MKINAVIESKDGGTLVLDFPRSIYDVYEKLQSVGIRQSPHQVTLSDEDGDDVRVKLYSDDEIGKHLLLTLNERNSLADANMLAFMVDNAKPDFRSKLEQNLLHDQYGSMQEVTDAIKQMLYESGPVKAVFYCPLVGEVTDDEGFSSPVDGRFLKSYAWAVEKALEADTADDEMDMADFSTRMTALRQSSCPPMGRGNLPRKALWQDRVQPKGRTHRCRNRNPHRLDQRTKFGRLRRVLRAAAD